MLRRVFLALLVIGLAVGLELPIVGQKNSVSARMSPSGPGRLVFVSSANGDIQISTVNGDGTGLRKLTSAPGFSQSPSWSPDGRMIVYVNSRAGTWQVYLMNADGSGQRALTRPPGDNLFPMWSPDGRQILYVSNRNREKQIDVMRPDGSGQHPLTATPGKNTVPVWSPDGTRIAFVSTRDAGVPELYVMNADGSGQRRLTKPDVYVSNAFGRGEKHLAPIGVLLRPGVLHPAWSPDGRRIAFVIRVGRAEQQISVVDLATGAVTRLATGYAPAWSPDGKHIAFVVARVGDAQIYVIPSEAGQSTRLTPTGINLLPAWSPDGRRIAFLGSRGSGGLGIYVMSPDGTGARRVGNAAGDLSMLPVIAWKPR